MRPFWSRSVQKVQNLVYLPNVIGDASGHRRGHPEDLMNTSEVVELEENRHRRDVILDLDPVPTGADPSRQRLGLFLSEPGQLRIVDLDVGLVSQLLDVLRETLVVQVLANPLL